MKVAQPPKIEVRNQQRTIALKTVELQKHAQKAVAVCRRLFVKKGTELERLAEISILIVSDRRMAALHRKFMNLSGPTDVITFQHGEIFISAETALRNAQRFGNSLARELKLYIVHALLHLHGFDDRDVARARKMRRAEAKVLSSL